MKTKKTKAPEATKQTQQLEKVIAELETKVELSQSATNWGTCRRIYCSPW